jgi:hypothetical protein
VRRSIRGFASLPFRRTKWLGLKTLMRFVLASYGTILSSGSFPPPDSDGAQRSIEIWVKPRKVKDSNTLVASYSPDSPRQLSLLQSASDLEIRIQSSFAWRNAKIGRMYVDEAFRDGNCAFWTVTSGQSPEPFSVRYASGFAPCRQARRRLVPPSS